MNESGSSLTETAIALAVLVLIGAQTWVVVQEATDGEAARWVARWWQTRLRPTVVRVVLWIDARSVIERMFVEEIDPLLKGNT